MARTKANLGSGARLADHVTVGYLALNCPLARVREMLARCGAQSKRQRELPHEVLVYYLMCMCLYRRAAYEEVFALVVEGLRGVYKDQIGAKLVSKGAISTARKQMGSAVFELLYREQVRPLGVNGPNAMPGVFWRGLRVMALDGSTMNLADEAGNAARFGYPGGSRGQAACPMLRFCALVECGTGVLIGAQADGYATGEHTLAERVFASGVIDQSMLILADRGFIGWALWQKAVATGAAIVCRARDNQQLPVIERLPDGSYLSEIYESQKARRHGTGTRVRVIEYSVEGVPVAVVGPEAGAPQRYRLITSLLDPLTAPAAELAALYQRRWRIETAFAELKTQLAEGLALRSKTPGVGDAGVLRALNGPCRHSPLDERGGDPNRSGRRGLVVHPHGQRAQATTPRTSGPSPQRRANAGLTACSTKSPPSQA